MAILFTILDGDDEESSNRFIVPFLGEVKVFSMDNEQGIDNDEEMMGVPKGIEASEPLERLG